MKRVLFALCLTLVMALSLSVVVNGPERANVGFVRQALAQSVSCPTSLPAASSFTNAAVTQGQFKSALTNLINDLTCLLGTDGTAATARTKLGLSTVAATGSFNDLLNKPTFINPAFSCYASANQSLPNVTNVKVQCNTENFDNTNTYDNSVNYRWTPGVAGIYEINVNASSVNLSNGGYLSCLIFKTSALAYESYTSSAPGTTGCMGSTLLKLGVSDYVEFFVVVSNSTTTGTLQGASDLTSFSGVKVSN